MNHHDENDDTRVDAPLSDVEHLLESMSLKSPSQSLDKRLAGLNQPAGRRDTRQKRSRIFHPALATAVVIACLMTGFLAGRLSNRPLQTDVDDSTTRVLPVALDSQPQLPAITSRPDEAIAGSNIRVIDDGLYLLDGTIPVRRYVAESDERIEVIDKESGKPVEIVVPVKQSFVQRVHGT